MLKRTCVFFLIAVAAFSFSACGGGTKNWPYGINEVMIYDYVFGDITISAKLYTYGNGAGARAAILNRMDEINNAVNASLPGSELYEFNAAGSGEYFEISDTFFDLLTLGRQYYQMSNGTFDPTVYPLVKLWGMTPAGLDEHFVPPTPEQVAEVLEYCGFDKIDFYKDSSSGKNFAKKSHAETGIDLGAIAKGYASDETARLCGENDILAGMIDFKGNIYAYGKKFLDSPWEIGVSYPAPVDDEQYICVLEVSETSVVTSGDYMRKHVQNGVVFEHIVNPLTGYPANVYYSDGAYTNINPATGKYDGVNSAVIVNPSSTLCDALATAVSILGIEEGAEFLHDNGLSGIINTVDGRMAIVGSLTRAKRAVLEAENYTRFKEYDLILTEYGGFI